MLLDDPSGSLGCTVPSGTAFLEAPSSRVLVILGGYHYGAQGRMKGRKEGCGRIAGVDFFTLPKTMLVNS